MNRKSSERSRKPMNWPEQIEVESDEDGGEGDEWLGKDEGFVSILFERFLFSFIRPIF